MADGQALLPLPGEADQLVAMIQPKAHGLFQQQVPAGLEHVPRHFKVQVRRQNDVAQVQFLAGEHVTIIRVDAGLRVIAAGVGCRLFGARTDRGQGRVPDRRDRAGMMPAPCSIPDQSAAKLFHRGNHLSPTS